MYQRILNVRSLIEKKSMFLFGPRSTGKTTLLRDQFQAESIVNLLRSSVHLSLAQNPSLLRQIVTEVGGDDGIVVIDEIQKLPSLLDEVHDLIETRGTRFVLTGSSGRKLKRSGVNLLAGRAWQASLFPLATPEIPDFRLDRFLLYGGMPQIYGSEFPVEELDAYVNTYLKEEIKEEALVQNFTHFARFLRVAAVSNGQQLNYANVSQQTGIAATSVRSYFEILSDTFVGFTLDPWRRSRKRKAVATAKFYFFDVGVANFLKGVSSLNRNSTDYGVAFEHFIAMELRSYVSYRRLKKDLAFWRTHSGMEVDFVVGSELAVEVKATARVTDRDLRGLRALAEEGVIQSLILVSLDEVDRTTDDGIRVLFWGTFLDELWGDRLKLP